MSVISDDLNRLSALPPQRRLLIVGLISVLFAISLLVGTYFIGDKNTNTSEEGVPVPTVVQRNQTVLSITSANQKLSVGKAQEMMVDLATVPVSAADVVLQFDPTMVNITSVQNGSVFDRVIRNRIATGVVTFSAAVSPEHKDQLKTGLVMRFVVTPLKAGSTSINFDHKKTITAVDGANTLGEATGVTFVIEN